MSKATLADLLAAVFVLALITVLVRPNSLAPAFLTASGQGLTAIVTYAVSG